MRMLAHILVLVSLALVISAIQITKPSNDSGWDTSGSQAITWTSVNTDPSTFTLQLFSPDSPNDPITIATHISTDSGSYTYTPSSDLQKEGGWRLNCQAENGGILAQSGYFSVNDGSGGSSGSSSGSMSSSAEASSRSAEPMATSNPTSTASPSATSNASVTPTSTSATSDATKSSNATSSGTPTSSATSAAASASQSTSSCIHLVPSGLLMLIFSAFTIFA